ncbi:MAG: DUF3313 family protein [Desulfobacterales bacterium]|nr:DUF3313 family protein [Desulfobacterales bacterium]
MKTKTIFIFILLIPYYFNILGCLPKKAIGSGFLKDYSNLSRDPTGSYALIYRKPNFSFKSYDKIMISPVEIWFSPEAKERGIAQKDLRMLSEFFRNIGIKSLEDVCKIVYEPAPNTLKIRAAITDIVPANPSMNLMTTFSFSGLVSSMLYKITTGAHLFVGQAAIEVEVLDSITNERLLAVVDRRSGGRLDLVKGITEWDQVKDAFVYWVTRFRERIDHDNGRTGNSFVYENKKESKDLSCKDGWITQSVKVIRGDLFTVSKYITSKEIKLFGVYSPDETQPFGKESALFTLDLIYGKKICIRPITFDIDGRTVSLVYVGDKCLNEELLKAGYGFYYDPYFRFKAWEKINEENKMQKKGVWAIGEPPQPNDLKRERG